MLETYQMFTKGENKKNTYRRKKKTAWNKKIHTVTFIYCIQTQILMKFCQIYIV